MSNRSEIEKQKAAWLELIDEGAVTPVAGDHVPFIDATDESLRVANMSDVLGCTVQTLTLLPGTTTFAATAKTVKLSGS